MASAMPGAQLASLKSPLSEASLNKQRFLDGPRLGTDSGEGEEAAAAMRNEMTLVIADFLPLGCVSYRECAAAPAPMPTVGFLRRHGSRAGPI
jgi:hypothetical protein